MPTRAVLDTNVLISALLFEGVSNRLVDLWQSRKIVCLISAPILQEYVSALAYPKFNLTDREVKALVEEEFLPYAETIRTASLRGVPFIKDPHGRKFLACAKWGRADYLLSGDKVLLTLKQFAGTCIVSPGTFLKEF